jgi:hypothetical protein
LSGTQISTLTLKIAALNDPEGTEKYNNIEVKYGATFYGCYTALDTCCCDVLISGKKNIY